MIQIFAKTSRSVLDLLNKWNEAKVGYDVGVDMTEDCRAVNGDSDHYHHQPHQKILSFSFPAKIFCVEIVLRVLADDARFGVCRSESAIYSRSKEARAPRALANVSASVRPGGTFTGTTPDADVILKRLEKAEGLVLVIVSVFTG